MFFDSDTELSPQSVGIGAAASVKYLYDEEVALAYEANHSLLIYQHDPIGHNHQQVRQASWDKAGRLMGITGANDAHVFRFESAPTSFLLVPHPGHVDELNAAVQAIEQDAWIEVVPRP